MAKVNMPAGLGKEHLADIDEAIAVLAKLPGEFDKREACGVDCQEYREFAAKLREDLTALRERWFPRAPKLKR